MQHGSTPAGGQLEVSGSWLDGGGGWCGEFSNNEEGVNPLPCSSNLLCILRPRP